AHYGHNCPLKVLIIPNPEPCNNQTIDDLPQTLPSFDPTCYPGVYINTPSWDHPTICYNDDDNEDCSIAITPILSIEEPDNSLKYEVFHDDHVKEISSGSPTTHSDSSLYAWFIFDLSINPFPPADRSDSYEFIDELIPFISPPEYDFFLFKDEPNSGDFTKDVVEDISPTKEPQVKEYQKKDKIGSKPDKNRKRGEAGKSQKQLQWKEEEKLKKTQKEGP
nr:hypothetical protein [Tanacetum cinerariifolium]